MTPLPERSLEVLEGAQVWIARQVDAHDAALGVPKARASRVLYNI